MTESETEIVKELDFRWATDDISLWKTNKILHMAGVTAGMKDVFFKGGFITKAPFNTNFDYIRENSITNIYIEEMEELKEKHKTEMSELKDAQDEAYKSLVSSLDAELKTLIASQKVKLLAMKEKHDEEMNEMKQRHESEIEAMKESHKEKVTKTEIILKATTKKKEDALKTICSGSHCPCCSSTGFDINCNTEC